MCKDKIKKKNQIKIRPYFQRRSLRSLLEKINLISNVNKIMIWCITYSLNYILIQINNTIKYVISFFLRTRYITEVTSAYAIAFILSLCATIANFLPTSVLDECDFWRPRFGENKCFYSGKFSWIWLGFKFVMDYMNICFCFLFLYKYLKLMCALDRINKAIWFYTPIGLCLLINFIMCIVNGCYIVRYKKDFEAIIFTILR